MKSNHVTFSVAIMLLRMILSSPGWLISLFLLLVCLVPFAGATPDLRGDPLQELDPFGFSLLTPSRHAFGPSEMISLAGLMIVPSSMIVWHRYLKNVYLESSGRVNENAMAAASIGLYFFYLVLAVPILVRSDAFSGIGALSFSLFDSLIKISGMSLFIRFLLNVAGDTRLMPLNVFIGAGAYYLGLWISDAYLIAPEVREIVAPAGSTLIWHLVMLVVVFTLNAVPFRRKYPGEII